MRPTQVQSPFGLQQGLATLINGNRTFILYCLQFISEMMFEVPLFGGVEGEFKADEEMVFVVLEVVDGRGGDFDVETEEALFVCIADQNNFVLRELGLRYDGIVEHEALLEQHFVTYLLLFKLNMKRLLFVGNILLEQLNILFFGLLGIRRKFYTWKCRFFELVICSQ